MAVIAFLGVAANMFLLRFLNNRGEAGAGDDKDKKEFTPEQQAKVDAIVQERLARERAKFSDYDELKTFKTQHEKELEAASQKELEAKKEYEKLKEGWTKKEQELMGLVSKKDAEVSNMKVESALMGEIVKQNAYADETMALLKQQAVFDKEGNIRIKGRDANGLEVMDSVEEGLKKFLTARPHLVKASNKTGGGTGAGNTGAGAGAGGDDLNSLNNQLAQAQARGDMKTAKEIKVKVNALLASQGIRRQF